MRRVLLLVCCLGALAALPSSAAATHGVDLDCSAFANQAAAQGHFGAHPSDPDRLDGNADGRACEALPCPCSGATAPAPETRKAGTPVECGGLDATARMKKLALRGAGVGRRITLESDPTQALVDRFGRMLAYVSAGGVDFGRTMISSGWARVYDLGRDFQRMSTYRRAQASARAVRRGVARKCGGLFHGVQ